MFTFLLFIFITVITVFNCESHISIHKDCRQFFLTVPTEGEFEYTSEDLEIMDEFKKYFYFLPECYLSKPYRTSAIKNSCYFRRDKVKFYPQESPYYLTIEYMDYLNEQRWLPGFRFDFDETECPTSKFNSNLTKSGYISLKRGDTACIYDFWIKKFDNFVNVSINGFEANMMDLEEFKNITFVFLRNGTYKVENLHSSSWRSVDLIDVRNLTKLHEKRNCKLIQPRKNNETKIAFIVHSVYKSCDLRLIMDNGQVLYFAKLPLKFSPVEQQSSPRVWDTSEAELPPSPDAEGVKYKYDGDFDVFILLIIWTILLASMLLYEILYRIFNKGQGIYPLYFAGSKSTDKHGPAEVGSNSASVLPTSSAIFKSMLADRWTKPNEPIKIEGYYFADFKELVTFIYSGECQLTNDNIFTMVDIAEFYAVKSLKMFCIEYLAKIQISFENVYGMIGFADKYSIQNLQQTLVDFASKNLSSFSQSEKFAHLPKLFIKNLLESNQKTPRHEELVTAVMKWAEFRAMNLQAIDLNGAIKSEMTDLLPLINPKLMTRSFLLKFFVRKQFLFSDEELNNALFRSQNEVYVQVTDGWGNIMRGYLQCYDPEKVVEVIKSRENVCCTKNSDACIIWNTQTTKPTTPSKLIASDDIEWYLIYSTALDVGNLAIKHRSALFKGNYLLAEMFAENGFVLDEKCKIKVV